MFLSFESAALLPAIQQHAPRGVHWDTWWDPTNTASGGSGDTTTTDPFGGGNIDTSSAPPPPPPPTDTGAIDPFSLPPDSPGAATGSGIGGQLQPASPQQAKTPGALATSTNLTNGGGNTNTTAAPTPGGDGFDFSQYLSYLNNQAGIQQQNFQKWADAQAAATKFNQGIEQGKLDLDRITQQQAAAYQNAMLQYRSQELAQQAAATAATNEIERQKLALQGQSNANTLSLEREKAQTQRMAMQGNPRLQTLRMV